MYEVSGGAPRRDAYASLVLGEIADSSQSQESDIHVRYFIII